jgi:hypothetical protein
MIEPWRRLVSEVRSVGTIPRNPDSCLGRNRCQADFGADSAEPSGRERVAAPEAPQPGDRLGVAAVGDRLLECGDQRGAARDEHLDAG